MELFYWKAADANLSGWRIKWKNINASFVGGFTTKLKAGHKTALHQEPSGMTFLMTGPAQTAAFQKPILKWSKFDYLF